MCIRDRDVGAVVGRAAGQGSDHANLHFHFAILPVAGSFGSAAANSQEHGQADQHRHDRDGSIPLSFFHLVSPLFMFVPFLIGLLNIKPIFI